MVLKLFCFGIDVYLLVIMYDKYGFIKDNLKLKFRSYWKICVIYFKLFIIFNIVVFVFLVLL